jgi:hypothetical protein
VGILNEFERRLEGVIEGIFSKAFRSGLQPVELARRILREMETNKTVGVREVWVPNHFVFRVSEPDAERFHQTERALRKELERVVIDAAKERGWGLVGPPDVSFETDPELRQGEFTCEASLVEGPPTGERSVEPAPERPDATGSAAADDWELALLEDGQPAKSYPLSKPKLLIGRLADSDIVLADPGVSRRHAEVRQENGRWMVADLGSTNGTQVNESTIGTWMLQEGDRITVGTSVLEFRRR